MREQLRVSDPLPPVVIVCAECIKPSPTNRVCGCGSVVKARAEVTNRGTYRQLLSTEEICRSLRPASVPLSQPEVE